jgi:hypothetical protein
MWHRSPGPAEDLSPAARRTRFHHRLRGITPGGGGCGVVLAETRRYDRVERSGNHDLPVAQRKQRGRRGVGEDVAPAGLLDADQAVDGRGAATGVRAGLTIGVEVGDAGERYDAPNRQGSRDVKRASGGQAITGRRPERQMTAGGMSRDRDAPEVESVSGCDRAQMIEARGDVLEGAGIAAAGMPDATVFEVPDGVAAVPQVCCHIVHQLRAWQVGTPAAAVDQHDDGMAAASPGEPELAELQGVGPVGDALVSRGARPGQKLAEGNGRAGLDGRDGRRRGRTGRRRQQAGKGGGHQTHQAVLSKSPFHQRGGSL